LVNTEERACNDRSRCEQPILRTYEVQYEEEKSSRHAGDYVSVLVRAVLGDFDPSNSPNSGASHWPHCALTRFQPLVTDCRRQKRFLHTCTHGREKRFCAQLTDLLLCNRDPAQTAQTAMRHKRHVAVIVDCFTGTYMLQKRGLADEELLFQVVL
jgi:hypothetical protein